MAGRNAYVSKSYLPAQQALPGAQHVLCLTQQSFTFFVVWPVANTALVAINKIAATADMVFFMILVLLV